MPMNARAIKFILLFTLLLCSSVTFAQIDSLKTQSDSTTSQLSEAAEDSIWKEFELEGVTIKAERIKHSAKGYVAMIASEPMFKSQNLFNAMLTLPGLELMRSKSGSKLTAYGGKINTVYVDDKRIALTGSKLISYLRSLPAKEIVSVELVNPNEGDEGDIDGYTLYIKTVSGRGGGRAIIRLNGSDGNRQDFSVTPSITVLRTMDKFSYTANVSYTPRQHTSRNYTTATDYYETGYHRTENKLTNTNARNTFSFMAGLGYEFNKRHSLTLNISDYYDNRGFANTTDNKLTRSDEELTTSSVTGRDSYDNTFRASLFYNGKIGNVNLRSTLFGGLRSERMSNYQEKEADGSHSAFNNFRKAHNHSVGINNRAIWNINKNQRLTLAVSYTNWNNFVDTRYQPVGSEATDLHYKYKEKDFVTSAVFRQKLGNLTLTGAIGYAFVDTRFPNSPENDNRFSTVLPRFIAKYNYNEEKGNYTEIDYHYSFMQPNFNNQVPDTLWRSEYDIFEGNPAVEMSRTHEVVMTNKIYGLTLKSRFSYTRGPEYYSYALPNNVITSTQVNGYKSQYFSTYLYSPTIKPCKGWRMTVNTGFSWDRETFADAENCWSVWSINVTSMNDLPYDFSLLLNPGFRTPSRGIFNKRKNGFSFYASLSRAFMKSKLNTSLNFSYTPEKYSDEYSFNFFSHETCPSSYSVSLNVSYTIGWGKKLRRVQDGDDSDLNRL